MAEQLPARDSALWSDWLTFLRSYKAVVERISQDMAERDLPTLIEYSVLFWLSNAEDHRLRQVDLSRGVLVSKSRVTRLMNSLVEQGFVQREKTHSDRRVTYAVLTEKGLAALDAATPTFTTAFHRYFGSQIAVDDHGVLTRILNPVASQAEAPPDLAEYQWQPYRSQA